MSINATENLFAYGTLRDETLQLATFGRRLEGKPDTLVAYKLTAVEIHDQDFVVKSGTANHRNLQHTGLASDLVEGIVFSLTREELEQADAYEPAGYKRVRVQLKSRLEAWIYLNT
jgi:gamma-glutamylcyclotransferase (GGCT)/AIG2-like uncharacterized protein YtfP